MAERSARKRVRVKVCGVTNPEDGTLAADVGADAVGLNFARASARAVALDQAYGVRRALPPFVTVVGIFVDPHPTEVKQAVEAADLDVLQFHGAEPASFCRQFGLPYIKATGIDQGFDFTVWEASYPDAVALLLDSSHAGRSGGTGVTFDWGLWPDSDRHLILAGGLDPDNVASAIRATSPFAVDVASGVEGNDRRRKDPARLQSFVEAVADA